MHSLSLFANTHPKKILSALYEMVAKVRVGSQSATPSFPTKVESMPGGVRKAKKASKTKEISIENIGDVKPLKIKTEEMPATGPKRCKTCDVVLSKGTLARLKMEEAAKKSAIKAKRAQTMELKKLAKCANEAMENSHPAPTSPSYQPFEAESE